MLMAPSVTNPRQRIIDHGEVFTAAFRCMR